MAKGRLITSDSLEKLFRLHLAHVIVEWDKAEEKSEVKRSGRVNIYRIGHLLKAMHDAEDEATHYVREGYQVRDAFVRAVTSHFNPTPRMRTFLRKIDSRVDVERGRWVVPPGSY